MKKLILFGLFLLVSIAPAFALTTEDQADIKRVEDYMNAVPPVKADFVQTAPSGTVHNGVFYIKRPGRLRFEYANPNKNFVVADGAFIHFWDDKNKNQSSAPISQTLADFLLRKKIQLSGDVLVQNITRGPGTLAIKVVQSANPDAGSLTLIFSDKPLQLRQWRIEDPTGVTEVSLINPQTNVGIDPGLFRFNSPGTR